MHKLVAAVVGAVVDPVAADEVQLVDLEGSRLRVQGRLVQGKRALRHNCKERHFKQIWNMKFRFYVTKGF